MEGGRRRTLGGLSPAQVNTRAGTGGARAGTGAGKRLTMAHVPESGQAKTSSNSRVSFFGKPGQVKTDPRPITDRNYMGNCIRNLINYLTSHGYDQPLSTKLLTAPTSKEFVHIVQFLFRKIDPNFKLGAKVEDEIILIFKKLQYPFPISKSALYTVGSTHTWPSLLASLNWLVELLVYEEEVEAAKDTTFDSDDGSKTFFQYVGRSYECFLAGDDERCNALEEDLRDAFKQKFIETDAYSTEMETKNAQLQEKIDKLKRGETPLATVQKKKADLLRDVEKYKGLIQGLEEHKATFQKKVKDRERDLEQRNAEMVRVKAECAALKEKVSRQEVNLVDVERMTKEKQELQEMLEKVAEQREAAEKVVREHQGTIDLKVEEIERQVEEYHEVAERLKLLPSTAKRAEGVHYEIGLNSNGKSAEEILGVDMRSSIKPALAKLKESYSKQRRSLVEELSGLYEKKRVSDQSLDKVRKEIQNLQCELKKLEISYRTEKDKIDEEVRAAMEEAASIEKYVESLKNDGKQNLRESEEEVASLQRDLDRLYRTCTSETQHLYNQLTAACDVLLTHKTYIEENLARIEQMVQTVRDALEEEEALQI